MSKWENNTTFDVVIEITSKKKLAERKNHWENEGYEAPEVSTMHSIRYGEIFQMCFEGTTQYNDAATYIQLEFLKKRNHNSIISRLTSMEKETSNITLQIFRGEIVTCDKEVVIPRRTLVCCKPRRKIEKVQTIEFSHFTRIKVNMNIPTPPTHEPKVIEVQELSDRSSDMAREEEEEYEKFKKVAASKNTELTYSVLHPSSIQALCCCLSWEEVGLFAVQMGLSNKIHGDLCEAENPAKELTFRLFRIWGGSKHSRARIRKIERGLQVIDRNDLADIFCKAFKEDLPFPTDKSTDMNGTD